MANEEIPSFLEYAEQLKQIFPHAGIFYNNDLANIKSRIKK
jgi:hypothetical protein